MLVSTDLSANIALSSAPAQQANSATAGTNTTNTSHTTNSTDTSTQLDPSLERLTTLADEAQDAELQIRNEMEAAQKTSSVQQQITTRPQTALAAQANQLSTNVINLLQENSAS